MAATYKVIDQVPVTASMPGGTFEPAIEVTFETIPDGIVDKVRIPKSRYSAEHVDQVITELAARHEQIRNL